MSAFGQIVAFWVKRVARLLWTGFNGLPGDLVFFALAGLLAISLLNLGWLFIAVGQGMNLMLDAAWGSRPDPRSEDGSPQRLIVRLSVHGASFVLMVFGLVIVAGWLPQP